ncbi:hypothetical protein LBW87_18470 [Herbaspirillum seropedicae]|nr:hypothetical protein [Herbaspirillum sp. alder98]
MIPANHQRSPRSIGQEASVVTLRSTAGMPSLYGADGVVADATPATSPDMLSQLRQRLKDDYPDLRQEARQAIEARLRNDYGVEVDADHTWLNSFAGAASSSRSYNGWQHIGKPLLSISLTDLQLQNFPADFGEDPNGLNANSGVYRDGAAAACFDSSNEVRLLSSDVKAAIRGNDFQSAYRSKLVQYWQRNENAVALHYEALALEHSQDSGLSSQARTLLAQAAGYSEAASPTWRAYAFDINSYPSKDMTWLQAADGRVVLLTPHGAKPVREYAGVAEMRQGIADLARTDAGRDEILRGFSIYNQQDGVTYQGVDKWLGDIATGGYDERIAMRPKPVTGKLFADMARRSRDASLDDVSRLVRSNSDIGKQEMLQALRAFNDIMGSAATQLVEAGYGLYAARTEGLLEDRRDAASKAWVAGLGAAIMILLDGAGRRLGKVGLPEPNVYFKPPTRLPDGRVGYPLGPIDAPRLPEGAGRPGMPDQRTRSLAGEAYRRNGLHIDHPWQDQPLDLSRDRTLHRYREPQGGLAAPRADIAPREGADGAANEPLDLSNPAARPSPEEPSRAEASAEMDPAQRLDPVTSAQINVLGFRERYDFRDLYGFQSFGGMRLSRTVAGLELNRNSGGVAQMIEGDMLRTFNTVEAAQEAAQRAGLQNYRVYHIRADGLRAVSFQDNRLNNPLFESLRLQLTQAADHITQPQQRAAVRNQLQRDAEQEVHLSTECLDRERVRFLRRQDTRH